MASGQFAENQLLVASSPNTSSMIDLFATYAKFTNDDLAAFKKRVQADERTLRYFSEYELILRCSPRCWENTNSGMLAKTKFSLFEKLLLEIVHFFYRMIWHFICERIASAVFDFFLCFQNVIFKKHLSIFNIISKVRLPIPKKLINLSSVFLSI